MTQPPSLHEEVHLPEVAEEELALARERREQTAKHFALMTLFMLATVAGAFIRKGVWLPKFWVGLLAALVTALISYRAWQQLRAQDV